MKSLGSGSEVSSFLSKSPQAMLKFSATWCGPCKAVAPSIEAMIPQFPEVAMADVDIDENQETAQQYNVTAVPSFVFLDKGIEVDRVKGGDVTAIAAALKKLAAKKSMSSGGFGSGHRLGADVTMLDSNLDIGSLGSSSGSATGSAGLDGASLERAMRASKIEAAIRRRKGSPSDADTEDEPVSEKKKETFFSFEKKSAGSPKAAPAPKVKRVTTKKVVNSSGTGFPGAFIYQWIVLYVLSLFTLDARSTASTYLRSIENK